MAKGENIVIRLKSNKGDMFKDNRVYKDGTRPTVFNDKSKDSKLSRRNSKVRLRNGNYE